MAFKAFTKSEAKTIRDLGPAKEDFMWLDDQIHIHQTTTNNTKIFPNTVLYKAACEEFGKSPFNYTVVMNDAGQPSGKTLLVSIDWNV